MNFQNLHDDELILLREEARRQKDWKKSDEIRALLDERLVFLFDNKEGPPDIHWCTLAQFKWLYAKPHHFPGWSKRKYLEYRIKQDIAAEKAQLAWQATMLKKIKDEKAHRLKHPHPDPTPYWVIQQNLKQQ